MDERAYVWLFIGFAAILGMVVVGSIPDCKNDEVLARGTLTLVCVKGHH